MKRLIFNLLIALLASSTGFAQSRPFKLWYDKPASRWEETMAVWA